MSRPRVIRGTVRVQIPVTVEYAFSRGQRGCRDSLNGVRGAGPPLEPDDPDEIDIIAIRTVDQTDIADALEEKAMESIQHECWADLRDR